MAKRFTDTEKWKKPWYRKLKPVHKCFWEYLYTSCNHAGIWEADFEAAEFFLGGKLDESEIREVFKKQYIEFKPGKWLVVDFLTFQYGELNENVKLHKSVIDILVKEIGENYNKLINSSLTLMQELNKSCITPKDKDKEKEKEKDKDKEKDMDMDMEKEMPEGYFDQKESVSEYVQLRPSEYAKLIDEYGKEKADGMIEILDTYIPNSDKGKKYKDHYRVLKNWVHTEWDKRHGKAPPIVHRQEGVTEHNNRVVGDMLKALEGK